MIRAVLLVVISLLTTVSLNARSKVEERLENAAIVLEQILKSPEGIPQSLLHTSVCVVVFPSVKKLAVGLGGSYGRGVMVCRGGEQFRGQWGAPAMMALDSGSLGLELGGRESDIVLLVMTSGGANSLLSKTVKLGVDTTIAAGPKGGTVSVETAALLRAQILSYSRSRGLLAGVSLRGSTLRPDDEANEDLYGKKINAQEIVRSESAKVPQAAMKLVECLEKVSQSNIAV